MYLISAYFDDKTNSRIQQLINRIAQKTGNTFMTDYHVLPHLTISSVEVRNGERIVSLGVARTNPHEDILRFGLN